MMFGSDPRFSAKSAANSLLGSHSLQFFSSRQRVAKPLLVVTNAARNYIERFGAVIHVGNLHASGSFARKLLVAQKIMFETVDQRLGTLANIFDVSVGKVGFEHGDDLVVSLFAVDHSQAADRVRSQKEVSLGESF